jgi:hypothetical protein
MRRRAEEVVAVVSLGMSVDCRDGDSITASNWTYNRAPRDVMFTEIPFERERSLLRHQMGDG